MSFLIAPKVKMPFNTLEEMVSQKVVTTYIQKDTYLHDASLVSTLIYSDEKVLHILVVLFCSTNNYVFGILTYNCKDVMHTT